MLSKQELEVDEDGSFEIVLSKEPAGRNWLKIEEETTLLMVRQTFADRGKEDPAELKVINTMADQKPGALSSKQVDEGLKTASMFVGGASLLFARWAHGFKKHVNQLPRFDPEISNAAGGDESIIYYHSYWKLEPDEALVIEVHPPDCDAWNFQLNNYWMESLDYRYYNICINKNEASYEADGSLRVIVSQEDPGRPNWIETAHHREGTMCWRWYRLHDGAQAIQPSCRVVKHSDLRLL
jgi:hypothetical protein